MSKLVMEGIEDYARAHTTELDPLYLALRDATLAQTTRAGMQVGHLEGRLLKLLVQLTGARRVVEVGTFTGYSALCMAEGLSGDGRIDTFDVDPEATAIAKTFWSKAVWGQRIHLHLGDARTTLPAFLHANHPIDLAFIDADKGGYIAYWDAVIPALRPGGLVIVDNVLWSGRVLDPQGGDDHHIVAFNRHAAADPRVEQVMLTVRDGMLLARRR
ncbi:MAG: class I SAM-dependent methyltransferase [Myxococcota bacterium]